MNQSAATPMLDAIDAVIREEVLGIPAKDIRACSDDIRSTAKSSW